MSHRHALAHCTTQDFGLESGARLPQLTTAYASLGQLNAARSNAVLVLHGYTTGPSMLWAGSNAAEGSWSGLIGPGRAIDTDRFFVICPNALGSSYGSTGPASINPASGKAYGIDFPRTTIGDMVEAQRVLIDSLGIDRLAAVAGPSMGSFQAFEWGVRFPERVDRVVAAVGAPFSPLGADMAERVLAVLSADAGWNGGRYTQASMINCLIKMRVDTLFRYGIDADLAPAYPDAAARGAEIERLAREWAIEFDAGALVSLAHACAKFDARPRLSALRAPLLYVNSRSDTVFSSALAQEQAPLFDACGVNWSYFEIDSDKGHLASGADSALWADVLASFMNTPPRAAS